MYQVYCTYCVVYRCDHRRRSSLIVPSDCCPTFCHSNSCYASKLYLEGVFTGDPSAHTNTFDVYTDVRFVPINVRHNIINKSLNYPPNLFIVLKYVATFTTTDENSRVRTEMFGNFNPLAKMEKSRAINTFN